MPAAASPAVPRHSGPIGIAAEKPRMDYLRCCVTVLEGSIGCRGPPASTMVSAGLAPVCCSAPAAVPRCQAAAAVRPCAPAARQQLQAAPAATSGSGRRQRRQVAANAGFGFGKAAPQKKLSKEKACPCGSGLEFKARRGGMVVGAAGGRGLVQAAVQGLQAVGRRSMHSLLMPSSLNAAVDPSAGVLPAVPRRSAARHPGAADALTLLGM